MSAERGSSQSAMRGTNILAAQKALKFRENPCIGKCKEFWRVWLTDDLWRGL